MKVWPKDEAIRKVLRHATGISFRDEGPAEWPDDAFTRRTVLDGDVTTEDPGAGAQSAPAKAKAEPKAEAKKE